MNTTAKLLLAAYQEKDSDKLREACDIVSIKIIRLSPNEGEYHFADGSRIDFVGDKFTEGR